MQFIEINSDKVMMTFTMPVHIIPVKQLGIAKVVRVKTKTNGA